MDELSAKQVDVAVIGLGAMGSMALWRLAARGAKVIGIEQFGVAHDQGSSHGESRIIRTAYFEDPRYVPLVQKSFGLWQQLEQESSEQLLIRTGALMIGLMDNPLLTGTLASVRQHHLEHEILSASQMLERCPTHRMSPDEIALYEKDAGFLRPEQAIKAAIQRAEVLGATVHLNTPVERLEINKSGVYLTAAGQTYHARQVIVSVGAWLGRFLPELRLPLQVERQVVGWFPVREPAAYLPERFPVYMHDLSNDNMFYGFPSLDGKTIKVARHHGGASTDAAGIDRTVHQEDLDSIQEFVAAYLQGVEPRVVRSQVCMYTNTPDGDFLVGYVPARPEVIVLGGFSGHGFKFSPVIGDAAADLALEGQTAYPIDFFGLERFVE
jgi:sarcosine oxidase